MTSKAVLPILLLITLFFGVPQHALAEIEESPPEEIPAPPETPVTPGLVEGTGTHFEVTNSDYLNVMLDSTEPVQLMLESVPDMITLHIEAAGSATSTEITLSGLAPSTTYYMYEDGYLDLQELTTDVSGSCTYAQDLSQAHVVFIQTRPSTVFLSNTGWSRPAVGTWDPATLTGTLTQDLTESIEILSDDVTLDGNGHSLTGSNSGNGVYVGGRAGVTIKNLRVEQFAWGIYLNQSGGDSHLIGNISNSNKGGGLYVYRCQDWTIEDNTTDANGYYGMRVVQSSLLHLENNTANSNGEYGYQILRYSNDTSLANTLVGNTVNSNGRYGIYMYSSAGDTLRENTTQLNLSYGIYFYTVQGAALTQNTITSNLRDGVMLWSSAECEFTGNTISSNSRYGVYNYYHSNNTAFIDNTFESNTSFGIYSARSDYPLLSGNTISGNATGVLFDDCAGPALYRNIIEANTYSGVSCGKSASPIFEENLITGHGQYALFMAGYSPDATVYRNVFSDNRYGIYLGPGCNYAQVTQNDLINNSTFQARVNSASGCVFERNYWSDWTTPDANDDGYVDSPYVFTGGQDPLPLADPVSPFNDPPVADAGANLIVLTMDQAYTVILGTGSDPDGDPMSYRWFEGAALLLDWTSVGAGGEAYLDLGSLPTLSIGDHTLTLEVSDGQVTVSDNMILAMGNSPPTVQPAPASQKVEIGIDSIVVIADAADFDGDTLTYEWIKSGDVLASGLLPTLPGGDTVPVPDLVAAAGDAEFPLGIHEIELRVSDGANDPVSAFVSVEVDDSTSPSLSPVPSVTILWPPNHELLPVTIQTNAFDNGGGDIQIEVFVQNTQSDDTGNTPVDFEVVSVGTNFIELLLRAERAQGADGRTYLVVITAADASGNETVATVEITAPHDRRKSNR